MSGYDIKKWSDEVFGYLLMGISYGQIYPVLDRLKNEGLATMKVERSNKGPASKVYQITDRGVDELQSWLRSPDAGEYDALLKLCFGSMLSYDENIQKLEAYGRKREAELPVMEHYLLEMERGDVYGPNTPYYRMITELGLSYFKEELAWCKKSIGVLEELKRKEKDGTTGR
jgi:DNA-binding PadR family transcriptional regulator